MKKAPDDPNKIFPHAEWRFDRAKAALVLRMVLVSALLVFGVETLLMLSLNTLVHLDRYWLLILDGFVLVLILFPLNYFLVIRPMSRQIEEHRRTNLELAKSSEILDHFFAIPGILIAYLDTDLNFIRVNQTYAETNQHQPEDFVGKNHSDLFPDERSQRLFMSVVDSGQALRIAENPFVYADHPERGITYWDWSLFPVKDSAGRVVGLLSTAVNVTERKLTQQALADSERRFRGVFHQTFQHILLLDPDGKILVANQTALDFIDADADQLNGQFLCQLPWWSPEAVDMQELRADVEQAAAGNFIRCEHQVRRPSGEYATIDITLKPLLDEQGKTVLLIFEGRDITKRIRAEEALRRSEEENLRLYEAEKRARQVDNALRSATIALAASLDLSTVLETLLDHLASLAPYTSAQVLLYDEESRLVVRCVRCADPLPEAAQLMFMEFEPADLLFNEGMLLDGLAVYQPDISAHSGLPFFTCQDQICSYLAIPLLNGTRMIGVCALEHAEAGRFSPEQIQAARMLTDRSVAYIQSALMYEQVLESRQRLQALSRRLVEVQENERRYVAQELHDDASQALASLMVGLRMIEDSSSASSAVVSRARGLKTIVDSVLENLHRLAANLHPATLDQLGLVAALRQHTDQVREQSGLAVQLVTVGNIERQPPAVETAIYRIVQEALTNVIKHAKASRVDILLERRSASLFVVVEDDGAGFWLKMQKPGQLGLTGMRERAEMLGGTFRVESAPGKGSTILLEIPCPSES